MPGAPHHPDEARRLLALGSFQILDTEPEAVFDDLTKFAARMCETPIALVSLVDEGRQWFKARTGLEAMETSREFAICGHAILKNDLFTVEDTLADPRFSDNPICQNDPDVRFYAGAPLVTHNGLPLGTLCVIDTKPRAEGLTEFQQEGLSLLAQQVMHNLELRRALSRETLIRRESMHRAKNMLSIIQVIVSHSLTSDLPKPDIAKRLQNRLLGMAASQDLLAAETRSSADLETLIRHQITPLLGDEQTAISINGPKVALKTQAAEALGMAFHELVTNALKHGALSSAQGRVDIAWRLGSLETEHPLKIEWDEKCDRKPAHKAAPHGFGIQIIESVAAHAIDGEASLNLSDGGAKWSASVHRKHLDGIN